MTWFRFENLCPAVTNRVAKLYSSREIRAATPSPDTLSTTVRRLAIFSDFPGKQLSTVAEFTTWTLIFDGSNFCLNYMYPKLLNPTNLSGLNRNLGFTHDGGGKPGFFRTITGWEEKPGFSPIGQKIRPMLILELGLPDNWEKFEFEHVLYSYMISIVICISD